MGVGIKGRRPRGGTAYVSYQHRRDKTKKVSRYWKLNINKQKKALAVTRGLEEKNKERGDEPL